MDRNLFVASLIFISAILGLFAGGVSAQTYPEKPITLAVGWPAGSGTDAEARVVGQKLSESLGQPVVVINKPGAGGNIALGFVAKSKPDGYTLLYIQTGLTVNPSLYSDVPFDPIKDFAPVTQTGRRPNLLTVHPRCRSSRLRS